MNGEIGLKKISDLNGYSFKVPAYQRGYKWRQKDVEYLITDIAEILKEDNSEYCLQPIVVAPTKKQNEYILVDGQQRLTTIWLITNYVNYKKFPLENKSKELLKSLVFDILYDTRNDSNDFLSSLKEASKLPKKNTCDTHYFKEALNTIEKNKVYLNKFFENLDKNVRIIWYEIDAKEGPAHFERLNNAKISLTNAELVKAWLFTNADKSHKERMACEWDEIEYKLQDEEFFSFITSKRSIYNKEYNRIELLIDLLAETKNSDREKDEFYTFNTIIKMGKRAEEIWLDIQKINNRLLSWYHDKFLFNLIGFIIECKGDNKLINIWKNCNNTSINDFKEYVREEVISFMPSDNKIKSMVYEDPQTKNVLLLFNILSLMSVKQHISQNEYKYTFNDKFHFDLYKKENWDKEHVHASASQALQKKEEWVQWLKDLDRKEIEEKLSNSENEIEIEVSEVLTFIDEAQKENALKDIEENKGFFKDLTKEKFESIYKTVVVTLEGESEEMNARQNSIGNLVLLNDYINRSDAYKVAPFSTKRRIIMEKVKSGSFVPLGTQNVFMKVYTPNPGHFYKWEKNEGYEGNKLSDKDYYIEAIINTFKRLK